MADEGGGLALRGTGAMLSLHRTHSVPWLPCPPRPAANSLCGHTGLFGCAHRGWASVHVTSPQPVPCMACEQVVSLDIPNNPLDAYKGLVQVLGLAWIQSSLMSFFCPFLHIVRTIRG